MLSSWSTSLNYDIIIPTTILFYLNFLCFERGYSTEPCSWLYYDSKGLRNHSSELPSSNRFRHLLLLPLLSQPQKSPQRQTSHPWDLTSILNPFPPHSSPAFLPLSTRLCCFTILEVITTCWMLRSIVVMHTLKDVLNMHLILERGGKSVRYWKCEVLISNGK